MTLTHMGLQATVLLPKLQDNLHEYYEVGSEDERRTDDRCRDPG